MQSGNLLKWEEHDREIYIRNIKSIKSQLPGIKRLNPVDFHQMPILHCPRVRPAGFRAPTSPSRFARDLSDG